MGLKILVIGCGSIGRRHIKNFLTIGCDVIAWNRGENRRKQTENDFNIKVFKSLKDAIHENKLDAAIICSPNNLHIRHALLCINSGLHIFVEKPLASKIDDNFDTLHKLANKKKKIFHVGCNLRFHFGPSKIKSILEKNEIGRLLFGFFWAGMHLPSWHPLEDYKKMYSSKKSLGGGAVLDFIHEIDLILWMFGKPKSLAGIISNSGALKIETEDIADVIFRFKNNLQVSLHVDYLQKPYERRIKIVGSKGWVEWDLSQKKVKFYKNKNKKVKVYKYPIAYNHNDMYISQSRYFIKCIKSKKISESSFQEGMNSLKIALAIKKSSKKNEFMNLK
tara:strand:+ start:5487 stop:6488 length:1002 start_codon:yes stop_codon:yes gene_type:complete